MAKIPDEIREIIKKFLIEASKEQLHIARIILFGSYAKGNYTEWSDIDLAVVSEDFEGIRLFDNIKLDKPVLRTSSLLETYPFRPEDFNESNPFVRDEILKYGIEIV